VEVWSCVLHRGNKAAKLTSNSLRVAVPVVPRPASFWGEEEPGGGACCILVWASLNTCNTKLHHLVTTQLSTELLCHRIELL